MGKYFVERLSLSVSRSILQFTQCTDRFIIKLTSASVAFIWNWDNMEEGKEREVNQTAAATAVQVEPSKMLLPSLSATITATAAVAVVKP